MRAVEETRFLDVAAGELRKAFTGKLWLVLLAIGAALAALTFVGAASEASSFVAQGASAASVTAMSIRFWFMMLLPAGLFGVLFASRESSHQLIVRSTLLAGSRGRLFGAKLLVSIVMGVVYAVAAVALALASLLVFEVLGGVAPEWGGEATRTLLGIAAVVVVAAPWGLAIGWLIPSSVAAVGVFLALTLLVDEALFRLYPEVGRFTMQIAMGSVYQDGKEAALPPMWGAVVMFVWLAAGLVAAAIVFRRRDLP